MPAWYKNFKRFRGSSTYSLLLTTTPIVAIMVLYLNRPRKTAQCTTQTEREVQTGDSTSQPSLKERGHRRLTTIWQLASRLPSKSLEYFRTLLRSVGLGILTFLWAKHDEPAKVLFDKSRKLALARCAIHLVPATVSIILVAFNGVGLFIGSELDGPSGMDGTKQGLLQVAAKIQELLIVSSMSTVIFYAIRSELVFGEGVPLGLLVSGWSFTSLSYFWSAELWGALRSKCIAARRTRIFFVVLGGGVLALLAGPAAAILMIPTKRDWSVGGGIYWLNGSDVQLWPTDLDADYYSAHDCVSEGVRLTDPRCPAGGILALHRHYTQWWINRNTRFQFELLDTNIRKTIYGAPGEYNDTDTWSYTAHAATATLQDAMRDLYQKAMFYLKAIHPMTPPFPRHLLWASTVAYTVDTKVPAVRVSCQAQANSDLWSGNITVDFPNLEEFEPFYRLAGPKWDTMDVTQHVQDYLYSRNITNGTSPPLDDGIFSTGDRRLLVIPKDIWHNTASSLGLVLLLDGIKQGGNMPSWNVMTCSVDARWSKAKSIINADPFEQPGHEFTKSRVTNVITTDLNLELAPGMGGFRIPSDGSMEMIRLRPDWYKILSPVLTEVPSGTLAVVDNSVRKQTAVEEVLEVIYNPGLEQRMEIEATISIIVADALSRSGQISNLNPTQFLGWKAGQWTVEDENLARSMVRHGPPRESFSRPPILKQGSSKRFVMNATYTGLVLAARDGFSIFCCVLLLGHACIGLAHTVWTVFIRRQTSGAWDTILEMIALAQNSAPAQGRILANTSAGIRSFKTVGIVACVDRSLSTSVDDSHGQRLETLQLTLKTDMSQRCDAVKPVVGEKYE